MENRNSKQLCEHIHVLWCGFSTSSLCRERKAVRKGTTGDSRLSYESAVDAYSYCEFLSRLILQPMRHLNLLSKHITKSSLVHWWTQAFHQNGGFNLIYAACCCFTLLLFSWTVLSSCEVTRLLCRPPQKNNVEPNY